jgi:hypothetical protein
MMSCSLPAAVLLGRRTYDGFAAVWPQVKDETGFADRINGMPKLVVSTALKSADWNNTIVISEGVIARVAALKSGHSRLRQRDAPACAVTARPGRCLQPDGFSNRVGRGKRLFADGWSTTLKLEECTTLGSGIVLQQAGVSLVARYRLGAVCRISVGRNSYRKD